LLSLTHTHRGALRFGAECLRSDPRCDLAPAL